MKKAFVLLVMLCLPVAYAQFCPDDDDDCPILMKFGGGNCDHSPIVIDLDKNGFSFSGQSGAILYDLYAIGWPIVINWVNPYTDDAFLAIDINQNGIVDDGGELFGNGTRLALEGGTFAPNGFVGLAQYDHPSLGGNDDGFISSEDYFWNDLILWNDLDSDGVCDQGEVSNLSVEGILSLEIIPRESKRVDEHNNKLRYWAHAYTLGGKLEMVDVFFKQHDEEPINKTALR